MLKTIFLLFFLTFTFFYGIKNFQNNFFSFSDKYFRLSEQHNFLYEEIKNIPFVKYKFYHLDGLYTIFKLHKKRYKVFFSMKNGAGFTSNYYFQPEDIGTYAYCLWFEDDKGTFMGAYCGEAFKLLMEDPIFFEDGIIIPIDLSFGTIGDFYYGILPYTKSGKLNATEFLYASFVGTRIRCDLKSEIYKNSFEDCREDLEDAKNKIKLWSKYSGKSLPKINWYEEIEISEKLHIVNLRWLSETKIEAIFNGTGYIGPFGKPKKAIKFPIKVRQVYDILTDKFVEQYISTTN